MYRRLVCSILAGLACAAMGCSPKAVAGDGSAGVDAVDAGLVDSLGDGADGAGEDAADALADAVADAADVEEIADEIADPTDTSPEVDAADADDTPDATKDTLPEIDGPGDATVVGDVVADIPDVPLPSDCTGDALLPPPDATVLTDVGPLIPNPVFTGCGKGKPEPVAQGTECCDCPPPYSCYCNGECAWLRTPDPKVPHMDGRVIWTGKWVVAMAEVDMGSNDKGEAMHLTVVERWNPSSTDGFEIIKNPFGDFKPANGYLGPNTILLAPFGNTVALGMPYGYTAKSRWDPLPATFNPKNPVHLLDVEAKTWSTLQMPNCDKLRATKTHLGCIEPTPGANLGTFHFYEIATQKWTTSKVPAAMLPAGAVTYDKFQQGLYFADAENFYAVDTIDSEKPWPDGSTFADGGHVLRYHVPSGVWSDVGTMPGKWRKEPGDVGLDKNGLVRFPVPERLDFTTKKVTVGPKGKDYWISSPNTQPWIPLECGLLIPSALSFPGDPKVLAGRPVILKPDLTIQLISPWGYPHDGRFASPSTLTDKEFITLGGDNAFQPHTDSYRFPISHLCKGASQ